MIKTLSELQNVPKSSFRRFFISREERNYFVENLAMELESGMDILQALDGITIDMRSIIMKRVVKSMRQDVEDGLTLWEALARTGLLDTDMIALVRIGESVGRLPENLGVVVAQAQKDHDFRSHLRSAMMYPIFVLILTVVVGIGVAWFILPRLAQIFSSLHVTLPTITKVLIAIGQFFGEHGAVAVPVIVVGCVTLFLFTFVIWPTKIIGEWILFHIPGISRLFMQIELARFGFVFGTLLQAGLPIVESIEALVESSGFHRYKRFYRYLMQSTTDGHTLRQSFKSYRSSRKLIPGSIQQMVLAAEQSGHLPEILLRIGKTFETKTEVTTKNLATILEPVLLVIVWIGVVTVALAVVLPVYSLIGQFNP